jgi:hypothetical protein
MEGISTGKATSRQYCQVCAQIGGGFAPFFFQSFQGGGDGQHHQRELEVNVSQHQPAQAVQAEAVIVGIERTGQFSAHLRRGSKFLSTGR